MTKASLKKVGGMTAAAITLPAATVSAGHYFCLPYQGVVCTEGYSYSANQYWCYDSAGYSYGPMNAPGQHSYFGSPAHNYGCWPDK